MDKRKPQSQNPKLKIRNRSVSPARLAAFEILLKVENDKAFSSVLLPIYEEKLEIKDRGLCHEIVLGVLRNQIYLDYVAQKFIKQKLIKFDPEVLIALRLAIYQILFLDKIPIFAAINEAVNLIYFAKKNSAAGLVNAVLRKVEKGKPFDFEFDDEIEKISIETSHPRWLVEHWIENFGIEETRAISQVNNETPNLVFRLTAKSDDKTIEILKKLGVEIEESKIVSNGWRVIKSNEMLFLYAAEGKIYFQDESSQLVGRTTNLQPGENFLDVCAAPGSKTTYAAVRLSNQIHHRESFNGKDFGLLIAGDRYFHRLRVLTENLKRNGVEEMVSVVNYDAENELPFAENFFDCILIDAPCSGTGTIRHNPEIKYFLKSADFPELADKQLNILENASKILKTGGRLIYSTCSLEFEENEAVIEKFLFRNQDFQKLTSNLPEKFFTGKGFARLFPHRDGADGFFISELKKS